MNTSGHNWTLVLIDRGDRKRSWSIQDGTTKLGRDPKNPICLEHSSVSRLHAEIVCGSTGVCIHDLESRNGLIVNDAPRQKAALQPGDRLKIGIFELELITTTPAAVPPPPRSTTADRNETVVPTPDADEEGDSVTIDEPIQLPSDNRELITLYHICFWLTEGIQEQDFVSKCLRLLLETFCAQEAHLYAADGRLEAFAARDADKPAVKLAAFLAKRFQDCPETVVILGSSIARHQQRIGQFNYLVGPLPSASPASSGPPFVVLLRPAEWEEFTGADRVLLQAICQLWVRGQARAVQVQDLRRENALLKQKAHVPVLLGASVAMEKLRARVQRTAATSVTVLLQGETGSGKEVVAQLIHENSLRRESPFIKVNCAAIPDGLIESELFGHVKGAFTDARGDRKGKFAQADHGTLFLDEIGEMPLSVQAKVLRAIENGEIEPLGSESITRVNVRIIAATHRDLEQMAREKLFRPDLFYRLNVVVVQVPPLREHLEDVEVLAGHFLERFCAENGLAEMTFTPEAIAELKRHSWPGNVRELRNVVQRCAASAESPLITQDDLRQHLPSSG